MNSVNSVELDWFVEGYQAGYENYLYSQNHQDEYEEPNFSNSANPKYAENEYRLGYSKGASDAIATFDS